MRPVQAIVVAALLLLREASGQGGQLVDLSNIVNTTLELPANVTPAQKGFVPLPNVDDPYVDYLATFATSELLFSNSTKYGFSTALANGVMPWRTRVIRGFVSTNRGYKTYVLRNRVRSHRQCVGGFVATLIDYEGALFVTDFGQEISCSRVFAFFP
jgi:hypothetical protein